MQLAPHGGQQLGDGLEGAPRRDDIIDHDDAAAAQAEGIVVAQDKALLFVGGDALDGDLGDGGGEVRFALFASDEGGHFRLAADDMEQGLGLAVGHQQEVGAGGDEASQLDAGGLGQLPVAEDGEEGDPDAGGHLADGEGALDGADGDLVNVAHGRHLTPSPGRRRRR